MCAVESNPQLRTLFAMVMSLSKNKSCNYLLQVILSY